MKFLIQTINEKVVHDFCFELERGIDYWKWKGEQVDVIYAELSELEYLILEHDDISEYIPQGTIEFVFEFINLYIKPNSIIHPVPISSIRGFGHDGAWITDSLSDFVKNELTLSDKADVYIKSVTKFKAKFSGRYNLGELRKEIPENLKNEKLQVTYFCKHVESEFRCFVYKDELLDIKRYKFTSLNSFPSPENMEDILSLKDEITEEYKLPAYSFDILLDSSGNTRLLEIHEIFSTGLYGFSDYEYYPWMVVRGFQKIVGDLKNGTRDW